MTKVTVTANTVGTRAPALNIIELEKVFGNKGNITHALNGVSLQVETGEFVAIMGPSGSGKSTLLNCIATIERPTAGSILVNGHETTRLRKNALAAFRSKQLGFIFQDSNLVDTLNGYENIALTLSIQGCKGADIDARVASIARELDICDVLDKLPSQMSGGQRQRVAAARAVVGNPSLVLADEPTGALDSRNARIMLDTLTDMNEKLNATILMVTHDAFAASFAQRVIFIKDGRVFTEIVAGSNRRELFDRIMQVQSFLSGEAHHDA